MLCRIPLSGVNMSDLRQMPIQAEYHPNKPRTYIPWWLAEVAHENYLHDQSLERIAERGGFGRDELVKLIRREFSGGQVRPDAPGRRGESTTTCLSCCGEGRVVGMPSGNERQCEDCGATGKVPK